MCKDLSRRVIKRDSPIFDRRRAKPKTSLGDGEIFARYRDWLGFYRMLEVCESSSIMRS